MNRERFNSIYEYAAKWCVSSMILFAPFSKSIAEIAICVAITFWILKKIINSDFRIPKTDLGIPLVIFIAAILPSFFSSLYPLLSLKAIFTKVLKYVLIYFVIVDSIDSESKLCDVFIIALISMILIMMDGFIQHFCVGFDVLHIPPYPSWKLVFDNNPANTFRGFPTASFPFPNDFAAWISLVLFPLALVTIFDMRKNKVRYLTASISLGLFYLLVLTKVRSVWFGLIMAVFYIAFAKKKAWIILFIILLIAIPYLFKMEMAQYILGFSSMTDRFSMWNTSWEIFKKHPIIGNGLNTFFVNFKNYRNDEWRGLKGSYAHNCYLQMACDTGLVGLAGFLWLIIAHFFSVRKALAAIRDDFYNSVLLGMSIGILVFLLQSFFDTNLYSLNLAILFWVSIGLSQSIIKIFRTA